MALLDSENRPGRQAGGEEIYHLTDVPLKGEMLQLSNGHFLRVILSGWCILCGGIDDL